MARKYSKMSKIIATEFTPNEIKILIKNFGRGGFDPAAMGSGCGNSCGNGCGNSCRRAVGFVFDEFGYVNPTLAEMKAAAKDLFGLKRSVLDQIRILLR